MTIDVRIEEDIVTNNIIIFDCTGIRINHVMKYTPSLLKKWDSCLVRNNDLSVIIFNKKKMKIFRKYILNYLGSIWLKNKSNLSYQRTTSCRHSHESG